MSWAGKQGMGYVRSQMAHHDRMVLAVSLNKAFACAGGALVFPNADWAQKVRNCGGTFIFSGPIQPPMLGAAIASAKLHQSGQIETYQQELQQLIQYTNQRIQALGLPQVMLTDTPLFFIPVGLPKETKNFVKRLMNEGLYINAAGFPATPMKRGGLRFTLTRHLTKEAIDHLLERICYHFPLVCQEAHISYQSIAKSFAIAPFMVKSTAPALAPVAAQAATDLTLSCVTSITQIDAEDWDQWFAGRGNFSHSGQQLLEQVFAAHPEETSRWQFYYAVVRDSAGQVVLAAPYSVAWLKDDMLAKAEVSKIIEQQRLQDPMYLVSKTVMLGCPITKGQHLYLDQQHPQWQAALGLLVEQMQATQDAEQAHKLLLGEFIQADSEALKAAMKTLGLVELTLPHTCKVPALDWQDHAQYVARVGSKYRHNLRKEVLAYVDLFDVVADKPTAEAEIKACYELYTQVFERSYHINVFKLPYAFFKAMCAHEHYDIIRLYPKQSDVPHAEQTPLAVMFSFVNQQHYSALIVGLDYERLSQFNSYKQALYQTVQRAKALGMQALDLAYTAEMEKKKVGAKTVPVCAYVQMTDHCNQAIIDGIAV